MPIENGILTEFTSEDMDIAEKEFRNEETSFHDPSEGRFDAAETSTSLSHVLASSLGKLVVREVQGSLERSMSSSVEDPELSFSEDTLDGYFTKLSAEIRDSGDKAQKIIDDYGSDRFSRDLANATAAALPFPVLGKTIQYAGKVLTTGVFCYYVYKRIRGASILLRGETPGNQRLLGSEAPKINYISLFGAELASIAQSLYELMSAATTVSLFTNLSLYSRPGSMLAIGERVSANDHVFILGKQIQIFQMSSGLTMPSKSDYLKQVEGLSITLKQNNISVMYGSIAKLQYAESPMPISVAAQLARDALLLAIK